MLTFLALVLRIFSNPFSNVFQKKLAKSGCEPLGINFSTYLGLSVICLFFIKDINFLHLPFIVWKSAILGGMCGALGNAFIIKALKFGELSVLGPINSYKAVVAMIFAIFLIGEIPSLSGILGVILIIFGSYFVCGEFSYSLFKRKDIQYRFLALVFTAAEAVFIKDVIINSSVMVSFIFWCWFGTVFAFLFAMLKRDKISFCKSDLTNLSLLILTTGTMQVSTNYVFEHMNVSYALALFQLSTILSVIFGWKFFAEKEILKKLVGSFIMVAGAVVLILA